MHAFFSKPQESSSSGDSKKRRGDMLPPDPRPPKRVWTETSSSHSGSGESKDAKQAERIPRQEFIYIRDAKFARIYAQQLKETIQDIQANTYSIDILRKLRGALLLVPQEVLPFFYAVQGTYQLLLAAKRKKETYRLVAANNSFVDADCYRRICGDSTIKEYDFSKEFSTLKGFSNAKNIRERAIPFLEHYYQEIVKRYPLDVKKQNGYQNGTSASLHAPELKMPEDLQTAPQQPLDSKFIRKQLSEAQNLLEAGTQAAPDERTAIHQKVIKICQALLQHNPIENEAYLLKGQAEERLGVLDSVDMRAEARKSYEYALATAPYPEYQTLQPFCLLIRSYFQEMNYKQAIDTSKRAAIFYEKQLRKDEFEPQRSSLVFQAALFELFNLVECIRAANFDAGLKTFHRIFRSVNRAQEIHAFSECSTEMTNLLQCDLSIKEFFLLFRSYKSMPESGKQLKSQSGNFPKLDYPLKFAKLREKHSDFGHFLGEVRNRLIKEFDYLDGIILEELNDREFEEDSEQAQESESATSAASSSSSSSAAASSASFLPPPRKASSAQDPDGDVEMTPATNLETQKASVEIQC